VFATALAADLVTKWAAFRFLRPRERFSVIKGFLDLELAENYGIVFGVKAPPALTILVSAVATAVVIWYLATRKGKPVVVQIYLGMILSGVIGNLYDRLTLGWVRDFILLYVGKRNWPNFNLADAFILIGVVLAMIQFILAEDEKKVKDRLEA
jgi:signal peptidase II